MRIRKGPLKGQPIGQAGLFTTVTIPKGAWIGFYTGHGLLNAEYRSLTEEQREDLARYAAMSNLNNHAYTWCPPYEANNMPDFTKHAMAAVNEPDSEQVANVIALATMMEIPLDDGTSPHFAVMSFFACKEIPANAELLWTYGPGYEAMRKQYDYTPGPPCPDFGEPGNDLIPDRLSNDAARRALRASRRVSVEELRAMLFDTHHAAKLAAAANQQRRLEREGAV